MFDILKVEETILNVFKWGNCVWGHRYICPSFETYIVNTFIMWLDILHKIEIQTLMLKIKYTNFKNRTLIFEYTWNYSLFKM